MPPRRRKSTNPPLDVDAIRNRLDGGGIVRVGVVPSGQFPDGVTGRVRRIGDPTVDGDEYIFVELPVGGAKDVLPFGVADLIPLGAARARNAAAGTSGSPSAAVPNRRAGPSGGVSSTVDLGRDPAAPSPTLFATAPAAVRPTPPSRADRTRGRRAPVTITVSTTGEDAAPWRVQATVGSRIAVRATPVSPSRVWEIVQTLGDDKLSSAVRSLLDDHRKVAQAKADALTEQLALVEAELKSFPAGT